jgi:cytochrome c oxidase assembly factor CtaG
MTHAEPTLARLLGSWSADPGLIALLAITAGSYLFGVTRARRGWRVWRTSSFLAGLLVLALALLSGIDRYADELLSVHVSQHLLLVLVAPALLLWGAPVRLALAGSPRRGRAVLGGVLSSRAVRTLGRPLVGFTVFSVAVLATHLTGLFELALEHPLVNAFEHALYFWAGVWLLAPLIGADPLPHRPGAVARFCWLMGAMVAMAIPGALLTFAPTVRYAFYLKPARALGRSALADQHLAGAIMWVGGGIAVFALALGVAMSAMLAEERRQRRRELHSERTAASRGALKA